MDEELKGANPKSTAKLAGHPIHPMLVLFPVAFLIGAFLCDIAYWIDGERGFAVAAMWLLGLGVVMALLSALAGFADFFGDSRIRRLSDAWQHMVGNLLAVVLAAASLIVRLNAGAEEGVLPVGLMLSTAVVVILGYTGWKGGELVYRHRVGVQPTQTAFGRAEEEVVTEGALSAGAMSEAMRRTDEARPRPH